MGPHLCSRNFISPAQPLGLDFANPGLICRTDRKTEPCREKMIKFRPIRGRLKSEAVLISGFNGLLGEKGVLTKRGVGMVGKDRGEPGQARPCTQFLQHCCLGMYTCSPPGTQRRSQSPGLASIPSSRSAGQGQALLTPHKTAAASTPRPLQRIACKLEPDMLRISKGIVSIFHTGLVIYNSLRELTLRLGSSDKPPKRKRKAKG